MIVYTTQAAFISEENDDSQVPTTSQNFEAKI